MIIQAKLPSGEQIQLEAPDLIGIIRKADEYGISTLEFEDIQYKKMFDAWWFKDKYSQWISIGKTYS